MGRRYRSDDIVWFHSVTRWPRLLLAFALSALCACTENIESESRPGTYSRIVALAPNLTELVFAAGADDALVGVSAYSDFPPAAREISIVGDAFAVDQEQLVLLAPDLLLVWESGTPAHIVDELRRLGYRVDVIRTRSLEDVAAALIYIGELTGHVGEAERAAAAYTDSLVQLEQRFTQQPPIRVFYQVARRPLFTINGEHYVSELISLCGGNNIFADLGELAPAIGVEAVVERDPEVMLASDEDGDNAFIDWQRWPRIAANQYGNQFLMPADEIGRATPRLLTAGEAVCDALQQARARRSAVLESPPAEIQQ